MLEAEPIAPSLRRRGDVAIRTPNREGLLKCCSRTPPESFVPDPARTTGSAWGTPRQSTLIVGVFRRVTVSANEEIHQFLFLVLAPVAKITQASHAAFRQASHVSHARATLSHPGRSPGWRERKNGEKILKRAYSKVPVKKSKVRCAATRKALPRVGAKDVDGKAENKLSPSASLRREPKAKKPRKRK